jgi:phosphatidylinositol-3-phosphatase
VQTVILEDAACYAQSTLPDLSAAMHALKNRTLWSTNLMSSNSIARPAFWAIVLVSVLGSALTIVTSSAARAQSNGLPAFSHVFIVVEENAESSRVLGNSARFVTQMAPQYSLSTQYHAIAHPSLPNYIALVAGDTFGIASDCLGCFVDQPNVADQIEASGRTWRAYAESLPAPCFVGSSGAYTQTHNPFIYFDSIRTNADRCASGIVPFTQFATDLAQDQLPNLSFITPNLCNDGHDCGWDVEDRWVAQLVTLITSSPQYQDGGVLFVTWDEGTSNASCCKGAAQGGQVATLAISPLARPGFRSDIPLSHYSILRTIEDAWGLPPLGHAADATPMSDQFMPLSN